MYPRRLTLCTAGNGQQSSCQEQEEQWEAPHRGVLTSASGVLRSRGTTSYGIYERWGPIILPQKGPEAPTARFPGTLSTGFAPTFSHNTVQLCMQRLREVQAVPAGASAGAAETRQRQ